MPLLFTGHSESQYRYNPIRRGSERSLSSCAECKDQGQGVSESQYRYNPIRRGSERSLYVSPCVDLIPASLRVSTDTTRFVGDPNALLVLPSDDHGLSESQYRYNPIRRGSERFPS